jgi:hypothetical protein
VSECDREASIMRRPWPTGGLLCRGGGGNRRYFDCFVLSCVSLRVLPVEKPQFLFAFLQFEIVVACLATSYS